MLGIGNSAMDIAVEASYVTDDVYLAARRGAHIVPKYIFGKPTDQLGGPMASPRIPFEIRRRLVAKLIDSYVGDVTQFGLPKPDHEFGQAHPTVSGRILDRITHGAVKPKPNISELDGREVVFADGSRVEADVRHLLHGLPDHVPVLRRRPDRRRPTTRSTSSAASSIPRSRTSSSSACSSRSASVMPLSEVQGSWIASYLEGSYALPGRGPRCGASSPRTRPRCAAATWPPSGTRSRSTSTTTCFDLARERKKGAARARSRGFALPVARRAPAPDREAVAA